MDEKPDIYGCPLWEGFSENELSGFISETKYTIIKYSKGEIIVTQGEICKHLYILAKGSVRTEMFTEDGGALTISNISAPHPLASAFLFADNNRFPVDVVASEECAIMKIHKDEVLRMFGLYPKFMSSFISFNSNITQFLSSKLQLLTIKTIKGKIAWYLLEQTKKLKAEKGMIKIIPDMNQTELAGYFGVARPSLARTLAEMESEGLISVSRRDIKIFNISALKELIMQ